MTESSQFLAAFWMSGTTPVGGEAGPWPRVLAFLAWLCEVLVSWMAAWWPLLVLAGVMALTVGALLARVLRLRGERERAGAVFFEIVPPFRFPGDGALSLWKMLAGLLHEQQRGSRGRVCLELWSHGRDRVVRAGLWVPATSTLTMRDLTRALRPGDTAGNTTGSTTGGTTGNGSGGSRAETRSVQRVATRLARSVVRAWPGCGVVRAPAPEVPVGAVSACELVPRHGRWAALVEHDRVPARGLVAGEDEPLRAVLDALAEVAGGTRYAALQVVVSSSSEARRPSLSGAPGLAGLSEGWRGGFDSAARRRLAVGAMRLLGRAVISVLDEAVKALQELLTSRSRSRSNPRPATRAGTATSAGPGRHPGARSGAGAVGSPVVLARAKAWEAKQRSGPHLQATVRFVVAGTLAGSVADTVAGPARYAEARRAARELASMLSTLAVDGDATRVRPVRAERAARVAAGREHGRGFIASARELAALWHLPHHPARHRLPQPRVPDGSHNDDGLPVLGRYRDQRHRPDAHQPDPRQPYPRQPYPRGPHRGAERSDPHSDWPPQPVAQPVAQPAPPRRLGPARPATSPVPITKAPTNRAPTDQASTTGTPIGEVPTGPITVPAPGQGARDAA